MKTTINDKLLCSVFGHNLKYTSKKAKKAHVLSCATCQSKQYDSDLENLNMYPFENKEIRTALQELFILQSQYSRRHISV
ncbi:hypothetical protein [Psychroserpens sp. Hel_I_66]|uniref:hypothetical protein n=1 Tax=Psychroserpens sp. Hel_I_66 TaxID=1250004 RepID=UPI000645D9E6|nr:hypothetical protein [Psychroserpens sp. Hel_I_66]